MSTTLVAHRGSSLGKDYRLFAALYDRLTASAELRVFSRWRPYVAGQATGRVLEIGAGTGVNLPYYPSGVALTIAEPNRHMLRRLEAKAAKLGIKVTAVHAPAERLPFPDAQFDTVVGTLVLCSVDDPLASLGEVRRVLRPGGAFRFMEHVRTKSLGWARFQDLATPLWKHVGAGCHPNRNTASAIQEAGLELAELREFRFGPYPVRPHVAGVARRVG